MSHSGRIAPPDKSVRKCLPDGTHFEILKSIDDRGKSRSPYSDKLKGDKVKLVSGDPEKVKTVLLIFRKYAEEGKGLKGIARELNDQGVTPPRGRIWLPVTLRFILRNAAYAGRLVYGRRSDGKHHWLEIEKTETGYESRIERKEVPGRSFVHRSEDECIVVEDCHEAIVPPALFDRARERMAEQKRTSGHADGKSGRAVRSAYLLSGDGLMKCSACRYSFSGRTDPRTKTRYYYDAGYDRGGSSVCRCSYVPADEVEGWILDRIKSRLFPEGGPPGADLQALAREIEIDLALESTREKVVDPLRDIERRLEEKRRKVKLIIGALEEESLALAKEELRVLHREIRSLEEELAEARAKSTRHSQTDLKAHAREIAARIVDFRRIIDRGTPEERKEFLRLFVGEILVDAQKGEVSVGFFELPEGRFGISYVWDECPQGDRPLTARNPPPWPTKSSTFRNLPSHVDQNPPPCRITYRFVSRVVDPSGFVVHVTMLAHTLDFEIVLRGSRFLEPGTHPCCSVHNCSCSSDFARRRYMARRLPAGRSPEPCVGPSQFALPTGCSEPNPSASRRIFGKTALSTK